jgi:hypothetical protein
VPQNAVLRERRGVIACRREQLTAAQIFQGGLHGALGKTGRVRERAQAGSDRFPFRARGLAVEIKINQKRGRPLIVADDVAQQNVEDVVIDRYGFAKARHEKKPSRKSRGYTFKRTAIFCARPNCSLDVSAAAFLASARHD